MGRRTPLVLVLVALALSGSATPARAADERAAAREFGYAAYRARERIETHGGEIARGVRAFSAPSCLAPLNHAPGRVMLQAVLIWSVGLQQAVVRPALGDLRILVADLDHVATDDPALLGGREAWRTIVAVSDSMPALGDTCAALRAWRRAHYAAAAAPSLNLRVLRALDRRTRGVDRALARAARRMRALGVAPSPARRFRGDTLFKGLIPGAETPAPKPAR